MSKAIIDSLFAQSPQTRKLGESIARSEKNIHITGLVGAASSLVMAEVFKKTELPFLLIFNDKEDA
ncbi:MAG: hypothetical protein WD554_05725, partial [Flavobacteriaceae bacterium]